MPRTDAQRKQARIARLERNRIRYQDAKSRLIDIYSSARHFKLTHARILEKLSAWREHPDYKRLTVHQRATLSGYEDALYDDVSRNHLDWRLTLPDGTWVKAKEYPYGTVDCGSYDMLGAHFWQGTDTMYSDPMHMNDPLRLD